MRGRKRIVTSGRGPGTRRNPTRRIRPAGSAADAPRPVDRLRPGVSPIEVPSRTAPPEPVAAEDIEVDLSVEIGRGLVLTNPILVASGPFGYGVEHADIVDLARLGAICTRGTTLRPRTGHAGERMAEVPAGLLNGVGLQNPGIAAVIERYPPTWGDWHVPVIVNLAAESVADFVELARRLDGVPGVSGIELNLSCPNRARGIQFGLDAGAAGEVSAAVRRATDLPLVVKLSPNVTDIRPIARAVADSGADAISAINTVTGFALDAERDGPLLGSGYGGLSGPAVRSIALRVVHEIAQVVSIPVIGVGGVTSLDDVLDQLAVGASAVGVGTAVFADPALPLRLVDELEAECRRRGLEGPARLVGSALPSKPGPASVRGADYRM